MENAITILPGRLHYVSLPANAYKLKQYHFFSTEDQLIYWNFYQDFGPMNIGNVYRFCQILNTKLNDPTLENKYIFYYSSLDPHQKANSIFMICCWAILYAGMSVEHCYKLFQDVSLPLWHDATAGYCSFKLTLYDTLKGFQKGMFSHFVDFKNFQINEYEHYEKVENGDFNWCIQDKIIAFAGPQGVKWGGKNKSGEGRFLTPAYYIPYFKQHNVTLVIRLNKAYYEASEFTKHGIQHKELYFPDGSNPSDAILQQFLDACENTPGAIAVHCKAGLGRTGSCIGCYLMKHYQFTAEEAIAWLRIMRPGCVIGPQQYYLKAQQHRMWRQYQQQQQASKQHDEIVTNNSKSATPATISGTSAKMSTRRNSFNENSYTMNNNNIVGINKSQSYESHTGSATATHSNNNGSNYEYEVHRTEDVGTSTNPQLSASSSSNMEDISSNVSRMSIRSASSNTTTARNRRDNSKHKYDELLYDNNEHEDKEQQADGLLARRHHKIIVTQKEGRGETETAGKGEKISPYSNNSSNGTITKSISRSTDSSSAGSISPTMNNLSTSNNGKNFLSPIRNTSSSSSSMNTSTNMMYAPTSAINRGIILPPRSSTAAAAGLGRLRSSSRGAVGGGSVGPRIR